MRIIHFSDIHAARWIQDPRGFFDKRLLGAFNYLLRRSHSHHWHYVDAAVRKIRELSPDIVICTGDLTTLSQPIEFEMARLALKPLVEDESFDLLYVPGNHDDYVRDAASKAALLETFQFMNRGRYELSNLPQSVEYPKDNIRFLMLNQAVPAALHMSNGMIDNRTYEWLANELSTGSASPTTRTVMVAHFPIFDRAGKELSVRRGCKNNKSLRDAFLNGLVHVSLCGHIHDHFARWEKNGSVEFCAGSLTHTGIFNMIELDSIDGKIRQEWVSVDCAS